MTNVLHEKECSLVVTDPKGEVYEMTSEVKRRQGYEVHVVNFSEMEYSDRYNPRKSRHPRWPMRLLHLKMILNEKIFGTMLNLAC